MLSRALEVEVETSRVHREIVEQVSEEYQPTFSRFLEIEDNHIEAVQFELDHLNKMEFWFGFEDFHMENVVN